jgi:predicted O-methyltransferase YrrM
LILAISRHFYGRAQGEMSVSYDFSHDWFSGNIRLFERFLSPLKGQPCRLLEIGTHEGRSASWLIDNIASHPLSLLETIDICENEKLRPNLAATGQPSKAIFHLGASVEVLRRLSFDTYDFIYVDGSHSTVNVLEDAVHAFRLLKTGAIMAFDDYLWDKPRSICDPKWNQHGTPKEAIDAFLKVYSHEIELLHRGYQVWIRKTIPRVRSGSLRARFFNSR